MVLPPFALEPNAVRGLKGEWVIYATVRNPNGYDTYDCSADGAINSAAADADATAGVGATAGVSAGAAADTDDGPMARSTYLVHGILYRGAVRTMDGPYARLAGASPCWHRHLNRGSTHVANARHPYA